MVGQAIEGILCSYSLYTISADFVAHISIQLFMVSDDQIFTISTKTQVWQFQIKTRKIPSHLLLNNLISNSSGVHKASFMHSLRSLTKVGRQ